MALPILLTRAASLLPATLHASFAARLSQAAKVPIAAGARMWDDIADVMRNNKLSAFTFLMQLGFFLPELTNDPAVVEAVAELDNEDAAKALKQLEESKELRLEILKNWRENSIQLPESIDDEEEADYEAYAAMQEQLYQMGLNVFMTESRMMSALTVINGLDPSWPARRKRLGYGRL